MGIADMHHISSSARLCDSAAPSLSSSLYSMSLDAPFFKSCNRICPARRSVRMTYSLMMLTLLCRRCPYIAVVQASEVMTTGVGELLYLATLVPEAETRCD